MKENKNKILELKNLYLIYRENGNDVVAVQDFCATFHPGEISIMMGPSGCGKTSIINLIGGVLNPNSGDIIFGNDKISEMNEQELAIYRKENIGFLFQDKNLLPYLTIDENLEFILNFHGIPKKESSEKIKILLTELNIKDRSSHRPSELSGGERQRAGLAIALANNPNIILADEPTGELDSKSRNDIIILFKTLIQKFPEKIIIIVSHDPAFLAIADNAYFLEDGKVRSYLSSEEISNRLSSKGILQIEQEKPYQKTLISIEESDFEDIKSNLEKIQNKLRKIEALKDIL
ncbi:MAG: ABC transporter ATP-binding protein [Promethearchaeota archaeon]